MMYKGTDFPSCFPNNHHPAHGFLRVRAELPFNWKDNNYLKNIFVVKKFPTQETLSIFVV